MKKIGIIIAVVIIALIGGTITIKSLERVGQGEVGVVYSMKGGVQDETLKPGWHFISPFDKMSTYPVSQQQLVLSNNAADFNEEELKQDTHVDAPADGGMVKLKSSIRSRSPNPLLTCSNLMTSLPKRSATGMKISFVSLRAWYS